MTKTKVAILSPANNLYSETFIQAHRLNINAEVYYYYNGLVPIELAGEGSIFKTYKKGAYKLRYRKSADKLAAEKKALKDSLKTKKIQVVLAEYGTLATEVVDLCNELNIPLIAHFHGFDASVFAVLEQYDNYKSLFEKAFRIIAVSKVMYNNLLKLGCPKSKLVLNTYGPNDDFFSVQPTYEKQQLIGIGRFVDKKAPYYTVLAFQKALKSHPTAKLIIAGDGYLLNSVRNLIKYLGIESNVDLPGIIRPEDFRQLMHTSRAFVQHSITSESGDMEGTPLAVLEASAAALPVISTKHAGIPDVVVEGESGFLVNEHDVDQMSKAMCELLSDKSKAISFGKNGRKRIKEHFTLAKHIGEIDQLIEKAIKRN